MRIDLRVAALALLAFASPAAAQVLTCTTNASDQCNGVHYHVQLWNPETKGFAEIFGHNTFSTLQACEAAKKHEETINQNALAHLAKVAPRLKAQPAKFGPCHCDMTRTRSDPHYLEDAQRVQLMRRERELKLMMLELLLDNELTLDSDLARAHISTPSSRVLASYWPRELVVPEIKGNKLLDPDRSQAKDTTVQVSRTQSTAGANLAPVEVVFDPAMFARSVSKGSGDATASAAGPAFINDEISRINAVIENVAQSNSDDAGAILEACNERIQVLTNLARLAETAGQRSRLAAAIGSARGEEARVKTVRALFGDRVSQHWSPSKPADLVFPVPSDIGNDPVAALRDSSERYTAEQKKLALYLVLARNATLTDTQQIWLAGIADAQLAQ